MAWSISGSVGRQEKNARNLRADVETVQKLLTAAAQRRGNPALDPKGIDGRVGASATSNTIRAIEAYQAIFMGHPDGVISPNGPTFRHLADEAAAAGDLKPPPAAEGPLHYFPFSRLPSASWQTAPRSFGANRNGKAGPRAHAGCDLYFPVGTTIHAITDGVVVRNPSDFYANTDALEVDHGAFIARYGEIKKGCRLRLGDTVKAGDPIAQVGHLVGIRVPSDMLHLELYSKTGTGDLTCGRAASKKHTNGRMFFRRSDLIDPTPFLNTWKSRLAP